MLLLTDDAADAARFQKCLADAEACEVLPLRDALKHSPQHSAIACLASLDASTSDLLREALSHHRTDPRIPVLFLMREQSFYASSQATALGATDMLPCDAPDGEIAAAARKIVQAGGDVVRRRPQTGEEKRIGEVGAALVGMMASAKRGNAISGEALATGAELLISSVRQTKIRRWLDVVRRHDDLTYQHCLLVAGLVASFSARLGVAPAGQRVLAQAALVHDIGKASIPRRLLLKPSGLTEAERSIIRTHPMEGYLLLSKQQSIDPRILAVVRSHHEYLDGSGYPDGLRAGQIPDYVRLTTVCDIYAALIERRAYKAPMPPRQAHGILAEMGGKLDQSLVRAFAKLVDDM